MYTSLFVIAVTYCKFIDANEDLTECLKSAAANELDDTPCFKKFGLSNDKQIKQPILTNGYLMSYMKNVLAKKPVSDSCEQICYDCDTNYPRSCFVNHEKYIPTSCAEALTADSHDGLYLLRLPESGLKPFYVFCMQDPKKNGSAWTLIQRRNNGTTNFYRTWDEYKYGFGNLNAEFFLGLQYLNALTNSKLYELCIHMETLKNIKRFACYKNFMIGNETSNYHLKALGAYFGDAGDALRIHRGCEFTTKDKDNDNNPGDNCAKTFYGGWWFNNCHESNLNDEYLKKRPKNKAGGMVWKNFVNDSYYLLKYAHMTIRPLA